MNLRRAAAYAALKVQSAMSEMTFISVLPEFSVLILISMISHSNWISTDAPYYTRASRILSFYYSSLFAGMYIDDV